MWRACTHQPVSIVDEGSLLLLLLLHIYGRLDEESHKVGQVIISVTTRYQISPHQYVIAFSCVSPGLFCVLLELFWRVLHSAFFVAVILSQPSLLELGRAALHAQVVHPHPTPPAEEKVFGLTYLRKMVAFFS